MTDRIKSLDGIRAFAVLAVFIHHALPPQFPGGFIGVDIFFVLSGFVITLTLRDGVDFRRFYLRRFFRIVPPILPVLAVVFGLGLATGFDTLAAAFSFMNWARAFDATGGAALGHFWSLSVEEQFYFVYPLALWLIFARGKSPLVFVAGAVLILTAWQIGLAIAGAGSLRVYNGLDTRGAQIAIGCLLAFLPPVNVARFWPLPVAFFAAVSLTVSAESSFYLTLGIPLAGIMAALLIAACAWGRTPLHWILESRVAQWGGARSYALYLWHWPAILLLRDFGLHNAVVLAASFALTCALAELSFHWIEQPAIRLRKAIEALGGLRAA